MEIFTYTKRQWDKGDCPFQDKYVEDRTVLYHGTSNIAEASIDKDGLLLTDGVRYSKKEVDGLLSIMEELQWYGSNFMPGVLKGFTQSDYEHTDGNSKPIHLSFLSCRCLTYAQKHYVGGETSFAIREAFKDLGKYVQDPDVKYAHLCDLWRQLEENFNVFYSKSVPAEFRLNNENATFSGYSSFWNFCKESGMFDSYHSIEKPIEFEEEWVNGKLESLSGIRNKNNELLDRYQYGVIYAVRLDSEVVSKMATCGQGKVSVEPIPLENILAKSVVDFEFTQARNRNHYKRDIDRLT